MPRRRRMYLPGIPQHVVQCADAFQLHLNLRRRAALGGFGRFAGQYFD
jgi:hypothetical protein